MTITVSCPSCETSFPVDPIKIPPEGVRAQCSVCPEIFDVDPPSEADLTSDYTETKEPQASDVVEPGAFDSRAQAIQGEQK